MGWIYVLFAKLASVSALWDEQMNGGRYASCELPAARTGTISGAKSYESFC